jgi:hypothetical protein
VIALDRTISARSISIYTQHLSLTAKMATPGSPEYAVESNSPMVLIPSAVFLGVAPLGVAVRLWSRYRAAAKIGADDLTICVSLVS